jgi:VWFA-related protein
VLAHAQTGGPTFTSIMHTVRVDVLATSRGQPVRGLSLADFEVRDNGVPQRLDLASFEELPLNLVLVFDTSQSMAGRRLIDLRAAGRSVLDALKPRDRAALVSFSHVVTRMAPRSEDLSLLRKSLDGLQSGGHTALVDASYAGLMTGESDGGRPLMIVFSDGLDTASWLRAADVVDAARRSDVVVYGVTGRAAAKPVFLGDLVAATGGRLLEIAATNDLPAALLTILEEFRLRYMLAFRPSGVARDGWHRLDVRVKRPDVTVNARPGYHAGPSAPR